MKYRLLLFFVCGYIAVGACVCSAEFKVFDGLLYSGKPDLSDYGIEPIKIMYESSIFAGAQTDTEKLDEDRIKKIARKIDAPGKIVVLDIECWPLAKRWADGQVAENVQKYTHVLNWFKEAAPNTLAGNYGVSPIVDYWRAVQSEDSDEYKSWQTDNDNTQSIADKVDLLFPEAYTRYENQEAWVKYAKAHIKEAQRNGGDKPVYVFLCPMYQNNDSLKGQYVPSDYWQLQLDTVYEYADGIVLWGGWKQTWDDGAAWWEVTKIFLDKIQ